MSSGRGLLVCHQARIFLYVIPTAAEGSPAVGSELWFGGH